MIKVNSKWYLIACSSIALLATKAEAIPSVAKHLSEDQLIIIVVKVTFTDQ